MIESNTNFPSLTDKKIYTPSTILKGIREYLEIRIKGKRFWLRVGKGIINFHTSGHCYLELAETQNGLNVTQCKGAICKSRCQDILQNLGNDVKNILRFQRTFFLIILSFFIIEKCVSQQINLQTRNGNCLDSCTFFISGKNLDSKSWNKIDWYNGSNIVKSVNKSGQLVFGDPINMGSEPELLFYPENMVMDSVGNIYINDNGNNRVQKWVKGATFGTTVAFGLYDPVGISVDQKGSIYIAQLNKSFPYFSIFKWVSGATAFDTVAIVTPGISSVFVDKKGNVYYDERYNNITSIKKLAPGATSGIIVAGGNGEGTAANQIGSVSFIYVDDKDTLYFSDCNNHRIQKWAPGALSGITVAGGNGQGSAVNQFNHPFGFVIDSVCNIYVADCGNDRIQKWAKNAISGVTVAGGNGQGPGAHQFHFPQSVCLDKQGNIYVLDRNNCRVQLWKKNSSTGITIAGSKSGKGPGSTNRLLDQPTGVYKDSLNNIYIADSENHRIQKVKIGDSVAITIAGGNGNGSSNNQLSYPESVKLDNGGNIYISDVNNNRIQKWQNGATSGITIAGGNGFGSATNQFRSPLGICLDKKGNTYISDIYNHRIQMWKPGDITGTTVAGGNGEGKGANQFSNPSGVALDKNGNIYISDSWNNRVQKWAQGASSGTTVAGGGSFGMGINANQGIYNPNGIFVDSNDNIYIADEFNHRVQKWAPGATYGTTVAGGNGRGSSLNKICYPKGIFVDPNGDIYIADNCNNRIVVWSQNQSIDSTFTPISAGIYKAIVLDNKGDKYTSNSITINSCLVTSVKSELISNDIKIIPNPTKGLSNISWVTAGINKINFEILDMNGKKVYSRNNFYSGNQINIEFLPNGLYLLKIQKGNKSLYQFYKIIKL